MARSGDVNEPTSEFPEYAKGSAKPGAVDTDVDWSKEGGDIGQPIVPEELSEEPRVMVVERRGGGLLRGLIWLGGIIALIVVLLFGLKAADVFPSWDNPFKQEETDRSGPPLLKSIQDLSRYVAAEGNFQVVIDLQQNRKYVPDFLLNERTLFVGVGTVDSYVDFATIGEGAIVQSADHLTAEIKLPAPQLGKTNLDLEHSYVFAEKKGVLNRLGDLFGGDPNRQREVYVLAEERITQAAKDSGLTKRAQENTKKMLEGLLKSLGYTTVTVTFAAP